MSNASSVGLLKCCTTTHTPHTRHNLTYHDLIWVVELTTKHSCLRPNFHEDLVLLVYLTNGNHARSLSCYLGLNRSVTVEICTIRSLPNIPLQIMAISNFLARKFQSLEPNATLDLLAENNVNMNETIDYNSHYIVLLYIFESILFLSNWFWNHNVFARICPITIESLWHPKSR